MPRSNLYRVLLFKNLKGKYIIGTEDTGDLLGTFSIMSAIGATIVVVDVLRHYVSRIFTQD